MKSIIISICFLPLFCSSVFCQTTSPKEVDRIIEVYSTGNNVQSIAEMTCTPEAVNRYHDGQLGNAFADTLRKNLHEYKKGNFTISMGQASVNAEVFAYCYQKSGRPMHRVLFADFVGSFLGLNVISAHKIYADSTTNTQLKDAYKLMQFAQIKSGRSNPIYDEMKPLVATKKSIGSTGHGGSFQLSSFDLVEQFNANRMRFSKKYKGKTLTVTGKVSGVYEATKGNAMIRLLGTNKYIDDQGFNDNVEFIISADSSSFNKALEINKNDTVTISGVFQDY
ncbi:MAG: OB-fold putative lipoprotein, partial [Proteobacteria bacterium]|nr:OB-fold putative lipoprotein [Pseudomonadota bacterium]MBU1581968.1 OB-fold putative lipoprotein [Pseudomonadota bacterium]